MTHAVLGRKEEEGGKKRSSSSSSECDSLPHPRAAALEPGASRRLTRAAVFRVRSVWPPSRLVSDSCSAGWRKIYRFFFFLCVSDWSKCGADVWDIWMNSPLFPSSFLKCQLSLSIRFFFFFHCHCDSLPSRKWGSSQEAEERLPPFVFISILANGPFWWSPWESAVIAKIAAD